MGWSQNMRMWFLRPSEAQTAESSNHVGCKDSTKYFTTLSFAVFSDAFLMLVRVETFIKIDQYTW